MVNKKGEVTVPSRGSLKSNLNTCPHKKAARLVLKDKSCKASGLTHQRDHRKVAIKETVLESVDKTLRRRTEGQPALVIPSRPCARATRDTQTGSPNDEEKITE